MMSLPVRPVAVIGAGPAGLMAAETLACAGAAVTVYDRMPSPARKFLMAGRGGLNLTHSEPLDRFLSRYGPDATALRPALLAFGPAELRAWAAGLGEETVVGSSGRVFPRSWKASPLLRAWLRRLDGLGVRFALRHRWTGFGDDGSLLFETADGCATVAAPAALVLALGGASWPRLGSDGSWAAILARDGIATTPLRPSNAGVRIAWSEILRTRFAGEPLKRIAIAVGDERVRGEAVVTETGLEGGAVYALSRPIRAALDAEAGATLHLDLRPDLPEEELARRLSADRGKRSLSTFLRKAAGLTPVGVALLREGGGEPAQDGAALAARIKSVPLVVTGFASLDRAISTAGGVAWSEIDAASMLRACPGTFVCGEMLDWDAPTGGYLLQACFATGKAAAEGALGWAAAPAI